MRPSLLFVVPAHGRLELAAVCLRQLRRTCDQLERGGIDASAVVIACDENLDTARGQGFGTIPRDNTQLSRRFNDGIQFAFDPAINPYPVDYVVTCGSDDWVDHRILLDLSASDEVGVFRVASFVREDGREICVRQASVDGWGIRVYPRQLIEQAGYRPAEEDRDVGCDTSLLLAVRAAAPRLKVASRDQHSRQIVDWKSTDRQIHTYGRVAYGTRGKSPDPFTVLEGAFPAEALREMEALY